MRIRFTLRDLLWLTVVAALAFGYWHERQKNEPNSPLKNSTGCAIAGMRSQNSDVSRYFASRAELCFALGEVEKCHDGIFQRAAKRYELFVTADGKELRIVDRETRITRIMSPPGSELPDISHNQISD